MSTLTPENLKYTSSHEWIRKENDNTAIVGITDHAQALLGDVVFVELPAIGKELQKAEACAVIESVKAAADVYAPLGGKVIAVNHQLEAHPEFINNEPYDAGWLCKVELPDEVDWSDLLSAEAYQAGIEA